MNLPFIAFAAASAVSVASLVVVRNPDESAGMEDVAAFDATIYEQSLENPPMRATAPYSEHPEWFQRGGVPDELADVAGSPDDERGEPSILEQLLRGLLP